MSDSERQGCLAALLSLFGLKLAQPDSAADGLPYRLRDDFLSPAELSFYRVLLLSLEGSFAICPKVNLADLIFISAPREQQRSHRNRIDRKHVDFLLVDPGSMKPVLGIELDDASHDRPDRKTRDAFVDQVFGAAGIPILHIAAAAAYQPKQIANQIQQALSTSIVLAKIELSEDTTVLCPKCQKPMVKRTAKKGTDNGREFWGCINFPQCRETQPV